MRLKRHFIAIWILIGIAITMLPMASFLMNVWLLISLVVFTTLSLFIHYKIQERLFEEIHSTKSWERIPLSQFKKEVYFSLFIGVIQALILYGIGYFTISTNYDLGKYLIYACFAGASQPFVLNFLYHLFYLKQQNEFLKKETKSFHQLSQVTQKKTLQDLMSPHFLFNSLNTAVSIIPDQPDKAIDFVNKLSDLYTFILKNNENQLIELHEELEIVEKYGFLIQTRFGDHFQIKINIPSEYNNALIPPLTLQNLVENASKHNAVTRKKPLLLNIGIQGDYFIITNNINPKKTFSNESTNLGLNYIKTRINQFSNLKVHIEQTSECFKVEIPIIYPSTI